jgi:hypothetical protein
MAVLIGFGQMAAVFLTSSTTAVLVAAVLPQPARGQKEPPNQRSKMPIAFSNSANAQKQNDPSAYAEQHGRARRC